MTCMIQAVDCDYCVFAAIGCLWLLLAVQTAAAVAAAQSWPVDATYAAWVAAACQSALPGACSAASIAAAGLATDHMQIGQLCSPVVHCQLQSS